MNNFTVDLTNCDIEPIHIPGKIQAHGFLVAIDDNSIIRYASENISAYTPLQAQTLLGHPLSTLESSFEQEEAGFISHLIYLGKRAKSFDNLNPFEIEIAGKLFYLIISHSGHHYLLEFEPADADTYIDVQKMIGRSVSEILAGRLLTQVLENAAQQIKKLIDYDRIMIYKFHDDGHGEVITEVHEPDLESWLGLHYPASDIPKQARELYKKNLVRIITDVQTEPSAILAIPDNNGSCNPLDLTCSGLRAVSPIHIQYLKNMGVASSFSISIMYRDELWGLIACHNYTPRFINYKAREASKLIGQIISSALEFKQDEENSVQLDQYRKAFEKIALTLRTSGNIADTITRLDTTILDVTDATGAALLYENKIAILGNTPDEEQIKELAQWLKQKMEDRLFYTHQLPLIYLPAKAYSKQASGVLACTLSKELGELMIWFKPEKLSTINWAGNPEKPAEIGDNGLLTLSPRRSFEAWTETIRYTSAPWQNDEIKYVLKLGEEVIYAINRQANEIRILNEKLQQAYEELDTFSFTISHDLRTPLATIKNYSEILLETKANLDDDSKRIINKVIEGADKLNFLIKEVLNYSRVGRAEMEYTQISMSKLLNDIKSDLIVAFNLPDLEFTIGETPSVYGDPTMITQVFSNLLNNAVKYASRSNPPRVTIEGTETSSEVIYQIKDNGVGINLNYYNRIFDLFKRMDNVRDYEGTGVGLAIVKRIIEKHHGRIWIESELGVGTVFYVALKKNYNAVA